MASFRSVTRPPASDGLPSGYLKLRVAAETPITRTKAGASTDMNETLRVATWNLDTYPSTVLGDGSPDTVEVDNHATMIVNAIDGFDPAIDVMCFNEVYSAANTLMDESVQSDDATVMSAETPVEYTSPSGVRHPDFDSRPVLVVEFDPPYDDGDDGDDDDGSGALGNVTRRDQYISSGGDGSR